MYLGGRCWDDRPQTQDEGRGGHQESGKKPQEDRERQVSGDYILEHGFCSLWAGMSCAGIVPRGTMQLTTKNPHIRFAHRSPNVRYMQRPSSCFSLAPINPFPSSLPLPFWAVPPHDTQPKPSSCTALCFPLPPPPFKLNLTQFSLSFKLITSLTATSQSHVKE